MAQVITVTEMARSFSDIIGRVHHKGEEFDIKKGSKLVAHISPIAQNDISYGKLTDENVLDKKARDKELIRYIEEVRSKYPAAEKTEPQNPMTFKELINSLQSRVGRMSERELDEWENNIKEGRKSMNWEVAS